MGGTEPSGCSYSRVALPSPMFWATPSPPVVSAPTPPRRSVGGGEWEPSARKRITAEHKGSARCSRLQSCTVGAVLDAGEYMGTVVGFDVGHPTYELTKPRCHCLYFLLKKFQFTITILRWHKALGLYGYLTTIV